METLNANKELKAAQQKISASVDNINALIWNKDFIIENARIGNTKLEMLNVIKTKLNECLADMFQMVVEEELEVGKKYIMKAFNPKPYQINTKVTYLGKEGNKLAFMMDGGAYRYFSEEIVEKWDLKLITDNK